MGRKAVGRWAADLLASASKAAYVGVGGVMASSSSSSGVGFPGMLAILFIGLKLGGIIHWSWWWVLSPIWISISIAVVVVGILAAISR